MTKEGRQLVDLLKILDAAVKEEMYALFFNTLKEIWLLRKRTLGAKRTNMYKDVNWEAQYLTFKEFNSLMIQMSGSGGAYINTYPDRVNVKFGFSRP